MENFEEQLHLFYEICDSPIEIELIERIVYFTLLNKEFYNISFIKKKVVYQKVLEDKPQFINYDKSNDRLSGIKIEFKDEFNSKYIEILPQLEVNYLFWGNNDLNLDYKKYRLDFGVFLFDNPSQTLIRKFDIECDGFEFHSSKEKMINDNNRTHDLLNNFGFYTLRFLGTQIMNIKHFQVDKLLETLFDVNYPSTTSFKFLTTNKY